MFYCQSKNQSTAVILLLFVMIYAHINTLGEFLVTQQVYIPSK
jgi:hypothetical protein